MFFGTIFQYPLKMNTFFDLCLSTIFLPSATFHQIFAYTSEDTSLNQVSRNFCNKLKQIYDEQTTQKKNTHLPKRKIGA